MNSLSPNDARRHLEHHLGLGYRVLLRVRIATGRHCLDVYRAGGHLVGGYEPPTAHDEVTALAVAIKLET